MQTNGYYVAPNYQLPTQRGLLKMVVFGFLTFGIYPIVVYSLISTEINIVASRYDGKHTMHYLWIFFLLSWLTLGIAPFVWAHKLCNRIGNELRRRGVDYSFDALDFWLWCVLGSLIVVGPFIFVYRFMKAMNLMNADYNVRG